MQAVVTSCIGILITNYFLASVLFRVIFYKRSLTPALRRGVLW